MPRRRHCLYGAVLALLGGLAATAAAAQAAADDSAGGITAPATPLLRFDGVRWRGVPDAIERQLRAQVQLARLKRGTGITALRFDYLLRRLPDEVDRALQPFGHYSAELDLRPRRDAASASLVVEVRLGKPVRVRRRELAIDGSGRADRALQAALQAFRPRLGEPLQHAVYEDSKAAVQRKLAERGYFDSELVQAQVEVTRALAAADLALRWRSGPRYRFGATRIAGSPLREGLLEPLIPYAESDRFHQRRLLELQRMLGELDYFQRIDIQPTARDEDAPMAVDGAAAAPEIGIAVALSPAPRNVYRAGAGFGTDSGVALNLGYDRRWLNAAGHKFSSDLLLGQQRSVAQLRYRIPAFASYTGWWSAALNLRRQPFAAIDSEVAEAVLAREAVWRGSRYVVGLHAQRERYDGVGATLVFPQLEFNRSQSDDELYPSRGFQLGLLARWGVAGLGSEVDFLQWSASATLVRSVGDANRLLLRGALGGTLSDQFAELPPSLRFFAGGDRSVRGYGYQELAPRDAEGRRFGGKYLLAGSIEWERMFSPQWGAALFVDTGNAFDDGFAAALGAGLGLRWRSPVGPVRVDLAHGFDQPEQALRLHVQLGPEL